MPRHVQLRQGATRRGVQQRIEARVADLVGMELQQGALLQSAVAVRELDGPFPRSLYAKVARK